MPIPATIRLALNLNEDEFFEFCQANRELRIERTAKGEILVMTAAGGYAGFNSGEAFRQLSNWAHQDGTGKAFDSSTGFTLPNGGMRSPDASWVKLSRLTALTQNQKTKFPPLCPDFVIEVASPSDRETDLLEKMQEYVDARLPLGWLILPDSKQVEIYKAGKVQVLDHPEKLSGDPILPGFLLDLREIWTQDW